MHLRRAALLALLAVALPLGGGAVAAPPTTAIALRGIARGIVVLPDPYFVWTPSPKEPQAGVLGVVTGPSKDFESIQLEVGADRRVLSAATRAGYEAYRIRHEVERGELQTSDVKTELAIVRIKNPFRDTVYAAATRQVGRTTVFVRGSAEAKKEAALARLVTSVASSAKGPADDVSSWVPPEVKTIWASAPNGELLVVDDGTVDEPSRDEIVRVVKDAFALVKRVLGSGSVQSFPPVVRITANRELFAHLAGRRDLGSAQAHHLDVAAELLVSPKGALDAPGIAAEAAKLALHLTGGVADADPVRTGLARMAEAAATPGAAAGALLERDADEALARAKEKRSASWFRLLMMNTLVGYLATDGRARAMDAELALTYASSGSALGRASLTAWLAGLRKWGHADAAAEAGLAPLEAGKAEAEYRAFWTSRSPPSKKPVKPGEAKPPR